MGENVFHVAMLLNTPSTLAIAKYLVKLYGKMLVNTPYQVGVACLNTQPGHYHNDCISSRDPQWVDWETEN